MKKFIGLFILSAALFAGGSDVEDVRNITTKNTTLPLYDNDKLQAILFGGEVGRNGRLIHVKNPVIDIVRTDLTDANLIKAGAVVPYRLADDPAAAFDFWIKRIVFSEGVVISETAEVDQENRQASGDKMIFFRSPSIDIDGLGYHANYQKRQCLVKDKVQIRIRSGADFKLQLSSGIRPEKVDMVKAASKQLFIDLTANEITLSGDVVLERSNGTIKCDKMVIYLELERQKNNDIIGSSGNEISRVECTGNVRMEQKSDSSGKGLMDFTLVKPMQSVNLIRCADSNGVAIGSSRVNADSFKWDFKQKTLTFDGNVKLRDQKINLDCGNLKIFIAKVDKNGKFIENSDKKTSGQDVIRRIECRDKVKTFDDRYQLYCNKLTVHLMQKSGNHEPEKMLAEDNVHIILNRGVKDKPSELFANKGELFMDKNEAEFTGNVNVIDPNFNLKSQKLNLYAEPYPAGTVFPENVAGEAPSRVRLNDKLELKSIVASKDVEIIRQVKSAQSEERATGELGVYTVKKSEIILSGSDTKPPRLFKGTNSLNVYKGGKIKVDLKQETAETIDAGAEMTVNRDSLEK